MRRPMKHVFFSVDEEVPENCQQVKFSVLHVTVRQSLANVYKNEYRKTSQRPGKTGHTLLRGKNVSKLEPCGLEMRKTGKPNYAKKVGKLPTL